MKRKKIYLNYKKTKYSEAVLFSTLKELRAYYKKVSPRDNKHNKVMGVSTHWDIYKKVGNRWKITPKVGEILLCVKHCGASIATHEVMHAVLWAWKHSSKKIQYPIVIKNMKQEEEILHNYSYAVRQLYNWYWKVVKEVK